MPPSFVTLVTMVALVSVLESGCASPPQAEKTAAADAISAAKAAGAMTNASDELAAATEALTSADARMAAKQFAEAKSGYLRAKELGDKATRVAGTNRTATKSAIDQQLLELARRWEELAGRVKAAGSELKRPQQQDWEADSKTAAEILQVAKALASDDPANARQKLGALAVFMDKWEALLTAASAPVMETRPSAKGRTPVTPARGSW